MRDYIKPFIEEEDIEIDDVIAVSGLKSDPLNLENEDPEGEDL